MLSYARSLFSQAWTLLRDNPAFLLLGLLSSSSNITNGYQAGSVLSLISFVLAFTILVVGSRAIAGMIEGVNYVASTGRQLSFNTAWALGRARRWAVVRLFLFLGLVLALIALLLIAATYAGLLRQSGLTANSIAGVLSSPFSWLGAGLVVALGTALVASIIQLTTQAIVLDRQGFYGAIATSWRMALRHKRQVLAVLLLVVLLESVRLGLTYVLDALVESRALLGAIAADSFDVTITLLALVDWWTHTVLAAPFEVLVLIIWCLFYRDNSSISAGTPDTVFPNRSVSAMRSGGFRLVVLWALSVIVAATALVGVGETARASANLLGWRSDVVANVEGLLYGVAVSSDGSKVAGCGHGSLFAGSKGGVVVWDTRQGGDQPILNWNETSCDDIAFSPDDTRLAAAVDNRAVLWNMATPEVGPRVVYTHSYFIAGVTFSPDSSTFAFGGNADTIWLMSPDAAAPERTLNNASNVEPGLAFSKDGRRVVATSGRLHVWDFDRPEPIFMSEFTGSHIETVALSADDALLATGETDSADNFRDNKAVVRLRQFANPQEVTKTIPIATGTYINALAFSPDGHWLAVAADHLYIADLLADNNPVARAVGHRGAVGDVTFGSDGRLWSAGHDGDVRVWLPETSLR